MNRKEKARKRKAQAVQTKPQPMQQPKPEQPIKPKKKRITFDVDPELHKKTCLLVSRQGTTIKDLLTNFLEQETVNEKI